MSGYSSIPQSATKEEAARLLYPGLVFDTALPQDWVNQFSEVFDVRPHFVWGYPKGYIFGIPVPVTAEGLRFADAAQLDPRP